jgi:hypothetical protein
MPRSLSHLARRFLDSLLARALSPAESTFVTATLDQSLARLFFEQPPMDQRHAYEAAMHVIGAGVDDGEVVIAALMHDVGKRHARLGIVGRSVASLLIKARLPLGSRMRAYRDHGESASIELARLGAGPLVVEFAMSHHGSRPLSIDQGIWQVLQAADGNQSRSEETPRG